VKRITLLNSKQRKKENPDNSWIKKDTRLPEPHRRNFIQKFSRNVVCMGSRSEGGGGDVFSGIENASTKAIPRGGRERHLQWREGRKKRTFIFVAFFVWEDLWKKEKAPRALTAPLRLGEFAFYLARWSMNEQNNRWREGEQLSQVEKGRKTFFGFVGQKRRKEMTKTYRRDQWGGDFK